MQPAVEFIDVDILFGDSTGAALRLLDEGADRQRILDETGTVLGVAGANLKVEPGEVCVLMGLSGSGKSTLLRAVNGLNRVTRGAVKVKDGDAVVDVASCDPGMLRRLRMNRVAMVFQQFALLPWRTVSENVGLGLELRGMARRERQRIVDEKLKLVGLDQWSDKYAHELSGGMQQRVGLARAFATDADILLMDEPFSALDPLIRTHLQDELLSLQTSLHKTILFVSHDLDEALKIGTHIAIMESGRIVQFGTPEDIVLKPANQYVADFVAHMNPLNVLRGASLMTSVDRLARDGDSLVLDDKGNYQARLDLAGGIEQVTLDGKVLPVKPFTADDGKAPKSIEGIPVLSPDVLMKTAIEFCEACGHLVLLADDGRLTGVIGEREIYRGILRQSGAA
ncbi:MAG: choline ABC transporter ATP-binding protein [Proteobacteria bacterium]|nr:MAG: choline ABC transporter ATP-binding protein [Pseudomonadota bacterium]